VFSFYDVECSINLCNTSGLPHLPVLGALASKLSFFIELYLVPTFVTNASYDVNFFIYFFNGCIVALGFYVDTFLDLTSE
jgi:hypothetical protein